MTTRAKPANSQHPDTKLTPAERTAKLLAFRKCFTGNFTSTPVPSKVIDVAGSRFATR